MNHVEALYLFAEERPFDYYYINLYFPYNHKSNTLDYSGPDLIRISENMNSVLASSP